MWRGEEEIKKEKKERIASEEGHVSDERVSSDHFAHVAAEIPDLPRSREDRAYYSPKLAAAAATLIRVRERDTCAGINAGTYNVHIYIRARTRTYTYAHAGCLFLEDTRDPCHSHGTCMWHDVYMVYLSEFVSLSLYSSYLAPMFTRICTPPTTPLRIFSRGWIVTRVKEKERTRDGEKQPSCGEYNSPRVHT